MFQNAKLAQKAPVSKSNPNFFVAKWVIDVESQLYRAKNKQFFVFSLQNEYICSNLAEIVSYGSKEIKKMPHWDTDIREIDQAELSLCR